MYIKEESGYRGPIKIGWGEVSPKIPSFPVCIGFIDTPTSLITLCFELLEEAAHWVTSRRLPLDSLDCSRLPNR